MVAASHTIELGLRNGTIDAIDLKTGKIKWEYKTEFPPRVSPLVTNDMVFAGYIPFSEKISKKSNHTATSITKSGVILALDKETWKELFEYYINAPISPVGPSIGNGMLFVPTGKYIKSQFKDSPVIQGSIVAFGIS